MSLNWDISKVDNWEEKKEQECGIWLNGLVWATMAIDMGEITEANIIEFYSRLEFYDENIGKLWSAGRDEDGKPLRDFPTLDEVSQWIGLDTNVSHKGYLAFMKKCTGILKNRFEKINRKTSSDWSKIKVAQAASNYKMK